MYKVTINVSFRDKTLQSTYETPSYREYEVADEAYRIGLLFAETQTIAEYGHPLSPFEFGESLKGLDYDYSIEVI